MISKSDLRDDKYYVYEHWLDEECIYVGKGRKARPFQLTFRRNKTWKNIVGERHKDIVVKIVKEFDENKDALKYETKLTKSYIKNGMCKANNGRCGNSSYGENNGFYGKTHSEEARRKMSEKLKGRYVGENNPFYGRKHTPEVIAKTRRNIRVYCIELDIIFESITDIATYFNIKNIAHISNQIKNGKPYKGLHFVELNKEKDLDYKIINKYKSYQEENKLFKSII